MSKPKTDELVGILVVLLTSLKTCGIGPWFLTAIEYIPRVQPSISPFNVPIHEIATNTVRTVPAIFPNSILKAYGAPLLSAKSSSVEQAPEMPM